jgi:EAL domain-containing protein (putative c-di-GMP-specific phosphodiesterase class I)
MSTQELNRSTQERMTLERDLHLAVERNEFELLYQPQVALRTKRIVGMEALLRWRHPERGVLAPAEFISVAEERGFIVVIGDWVLREACRQGRKFRDRGLTEFRVAVNLSARQFRDLTLVDSVETALAESGLEPRCLELEITESVAMENIELTVRLLTRLRELGVAIAIDDFGTGHSSMSYLKRFPIDALKIDRSFVEDLPHGKEDAAIARSIIQLADGLNLRVIAEGVETTEQADFFTPYDCDVQGFYFAHPMPADQCEALFAKGIAV